MPILKDTAAVLRVHEQSNTSQIVVFLGRELGQFRVYAKGSRRWPKKGFEGGFDLLTRGEVLAYPRPGESMWILKEWDEHARVKLNGTLELLTAASFLCELTEALTRSTSGSAFDSTSTDPSSAQLSDLLAATTTALESHPSPDLLALAFTLKALRIEGVLPDLENCQRCSRAFFGKKMKAANVWLDARGLTCLDCMKLNEEPPVRGAWLAPEAQRLLIHFSNSAGPVRVSPNAARQLGRTLILLVHGALEHDLRTLLPAARMVAGFSQAK